MTPTVSGEVVVTGLVTGGHRIADINVMVPHRVPVVIPGTQAYKSRDLWRGLQQGLLFQLDAGAGLIIESSEAARLATFPASPPADPENTRDWRKEAEQLAAQVTALEAELERLRAALTTGPTLQQLSEGMTQIQAQLSQIRSQPVTVQAVAAAPGSAGLVDDTVPVFIPTQIRPEGAETTIRPTIETTKTSISSASDRLRQMRESKAG